MEQISESLRQGKEQRARQTRLIKQIIMAVIAVGLLSLDWWLISQALFTGRPASFWVWPILTTSLWIGATSMLALVNPNQYIMLGVNILGLAAFVLLMPQDPLVIAGGIIFTIMHMFFQRRIQDEENNQLNFSFRRTLGNSQGLMTYALLILIGFLVYSNVDQDFNRDKEGFYRKLSQTSVRGLPYVSQDSERFNLSQTVGDFFRNEAQQQYPEFDSATPEQQEQIINQVRDDFSRQFGVEANQNTSLRAALTEVVAQRLQEALGPYERFFPLFFTVAVIALLRTIAFVFNWVTLFLSWVIYKILLAGRFFRLNKEVVEVEKLVI